MDADAKSGPAEVGFGVHSDVLEDVLAEMVVGEVVEVMPPPDPESKLFDPGLWIDRAVDLELPPRSPDRRARRPR